MILDSVTVYMQEEMGGRLGGALEAPVDEQQWRLEVERVLPSLRVHLRQDNRVRGESRGEGGGGGGG